MRALLAALLLAGVAAGCGPKGVRLTIPELRALEQCVIEAEDQVERQNCVERYIPPAGR